MAEHNYALYYPTIEFQEYEWLWGASLLWDRIYKIVPERYEPDEPPNVLELLEEGEIGIPINPKEYAHAVADEFVEKLSSPQWDACALSYSPGDSTEDYRRIHKNKIDVRLREMLISKGQASAQGDWFQVPNEFSAHYMTYLANAIAEKNKLHLVSDFSTAWTCSNYFRYDGKIDDYPASHLESQLALFIVKEFLPTNLTTITTKELIRFRRERREQRQRFMKSIQTAAQSISRCTDPAIVQDLVRDLKKDIDSAIDDYKRSADILKVTGWTGLKTLSFPVLTAVIKMLVELDPASVAVLSTAGLGLGVLTGLREYQHKKAQLAKTSDYSYLISMRKNWIGRDQTASYTESLWKEVDDFIND
jgi:hypothetical protein